MGRGRQLLDGIREATVVGLYACFTVHWNPLDGSLKELLLGPHMSGSVGLSEDPRICFSDKFSSDADPRTNFT